MEFDFLCLLTLYMYTVTYNASVHFSEYVKKEI